MYNYERKTEVWRVQVSYATWDYKLDCLDCGVFASGTQKKQNKILQSVICICQQFPDGCILILTIYISPVSSLSYQQWHWARSSQKRWWFGVPVYQPHTEKSPSLVHVPHHLLQLTSSLNLLLKMSWCLKFSVSFAVSGCITAKNDTFSVQTCPIQQLGQWPYTLQTVTFWSQVYTCRALWSG